MPIAGAFNEKCWHTATILPILVKRVPVFGQCGDCVELYFPDPV